MIVTMRLPDQCLHARCLRQVPELVESVSVLSQLMESRCAAFSKLSRLKGKLDLMLSQVRPRRHLPAMLLTDV